MRIVFFLHCLWRCLYMLRIWLVDSSFRCDAWRNWICRWTRRSVIIPFKLGKCVFDQNLFVIHYENLCSTDDTLVPHLFTIRRVTYCRLTYLTLTFDSHFSLSLSLFAVGVGKSESTKLERHSDSTSRHRNCVGSHRNICGKWIFNICRAQWKCSINYLFMHLHEALVGHTLERGNEFNGGGNSRALVRRS